MDNICVDSSDDEGNKDCVTPTFNRDALHQSSKELLNFLGKKSSTDTNSNETVLAPSQSEEESLLSSNPNLGGELSLSQTQSMVTNSQTSTLNLDLSQCENTSQDLEVSQDLGASQDQEKSSSKIPLASLPFIVPNELKKRTTVLVQLEDKQVDLSGDIGAIGRINLYGKKNLLLDLKGHQYTGEIVPCGTFMVVGMGATEAKVECVVSDFCQISRKKNIFEGMKGVVTSGIMDDTLFHYQEEDVNQQTQPSSDLKNTIETPSVKKKGKKGDTKTPLKKQKGEKEESSVKKKRQLTLTPLSSSVSKKSKNKKEI